MAHFFGQIGGIWREVGGEGVVVDLQHVAQAAIAEGQVRVEVEKVDLKSFNSIKPKFTVTGATGQTVCVRRQRNSGWHPFQISK